MITMLRSFRQGGFAAEEMAILERVLPHVQRAAHLHHKISLMRLRHHAFQAGLDRLSFGVVVVDFGGRIVVINRAAEEMAAAGDGFIVRGGRLAAERPEEAAALARLISEAARTACRRAGEGGGSLRISRRSGSALYGLLVVPLGERSALPEIPAGPQVLILITDPEQRPKVLGRRLIELFGLTAAEARLAAGLAEGKRLEEIAAERSVRMPTLRTQLRMVLDKTGTTRQADLVRLIAGLPSVRPPG
jgi:DNA-binding CsgD family transcriptional regulator